MIEIAMYTLTAGMFVIGVFGVREIIRETRATKEYVQSLKKRDDLRAEVARRKKGHKAIKRERELLEAATADLLRAEGRLR